MSNSEREKFFDLFWKVYPRKRGKFAARTAFDWVLKQATAEEIIEGARRYAAERQGQDPQFTAHPATWLRAGRWLDEPDQKVTPKPYNLPRERSPSYDSVGAFLARWEHNNTRRSN